VADKVCPVHLEVVQQGNDVGGLQFEAAGRSAALAVPAPVVADSLELAERRLFGQRTKEVGEDGAVDEQHRIPLTLDVVGQLDAVHLGCLHRNPLVRRSRSCGARLASF
jgi:hypothetical protein